MAEIYKVKMTMEVEAFIEANNEEQLMDWMNTHDPIDLMTDEDYGYTDVEYKDEIICTVNGYADFSIIDSLEG